MGGPVRADHRYIQRMVDVMFGGSVTHTLKGYRSITAVFRSAGGSWERLFDGNSRDLGLLKRCLKVAVKQGVLPPAPNWVSDAKKGKKKSGSR